MEKSEIMTVFHEIYEACKETIAPDFISLDGVPIGSPNLNGENNKFMITIKTILDSPTRSCIENVIKHNQLALREENGYLVIFRDHRTINLL